MNSYSCLTVYDHLNNNKWNHSETKPNSKSSFSESFNYAYYKFGCMGIKSSSVSSKLENS